MQIIIASVRKRLRVFAALVLVMLVGAMAVLIRITYSSQVELRRSALHKVRYDGEHIADALAYFFSDRKGDILDLAESRELSVFFESKALSMSMAYGLEAALDAISMRLQRMLAQKRFDGKPIYSWIVFLDVDGRVMAEAGDGASGEASDQGMEGVNESDLCEPTILLENQGGELSMIVSTAYFFKGEYAGRILAGINGDQLYQRLLRADMGGHRVYGLVCGRGHLHMKEGTLLRLPLSLTMGKEMAELPPIPELDAYVSGSENPEPASGGESPQRSWLGLLLPIRGTPLLLGMLAPEGEVFGRSAPWQIPVVMAAMTLTAIGAGGFLWRSGARNVALRTRLEETTKREKIIQEVNEQLAKEIGERRIAETVLEEHRTRLDLALRGADLGVWDWHIPTGRVTFNERWAEMLGYSLAEIRPIVETWKEILHPDDAELVMNAVQAHMEGLSTFYESEHRLRGKAGDWIWVLDRGQVVERDVDGRPIRMAGTHLDITGRKKAEAEIRRYQTELEQLVEARTHQLEEAQKELINNAMEAGRAQLAAMMLHNIGNAVTPINVLLAAMKKSDTYRALEYLDQCRLDLEAHLPDLGPYLIEDPRGRQVFAYLGELIRSLKREHARQKHREKEMETAVSYISEILTLQQSYAPSERQVRTITDVNHLLDSALSIQASTLEKRRIRIAKAFDDRLPKVLIDRNRLMQVVVNIIKNAYEAIELLEDDSLERRIDLRTSCENGAVTIEIRDSGVGVDPEILPDIFELGKSGKGSSGFGLYYCRMFVQANNGKLTVESPGNGRGTTVTLSFNMAEQAHG